MKRSIARAPFALLVLLSQAALAQSAAVTPPPSAQPTPSAEVTSQEPAAPAPVPDANAAADPAPPSAPEAAASTPAPLPPPASGPASPPAPAAAPAAAAAAPPPLDGSAQVQPLPPLPPPGPVPAAEPAKPKKPKALQFAITWDIVFPISMALTPASAGKLSGVGYQAFSLDLRYWIRDQIAIGALVGWHTVNSKTTLSFEGEDGVTQTGTTYVEANTNEILARIHYAMADRAAARAYAPPPGKKVEIGKQIIPMVALGAGAGRFVQTLDTGLSRTATERWMAVVSPEVGLEFPTKMFPIILAGRLHYFFGSSVGPDELYGTLSLGGAFE